MVYRFSLLFCLRASSKVQKLCPLKFRISSQKNGSHSASLPYKFQVCQLLESGETIYSLSVSLSLSLSLCLSLSLSTVNPVSLRMLTDTLTWTHIHKTHHVNIHRWRQEGGWGRKMEVWGGDIVLHGEAHWLAVKLIGLPTPHYVENAWYKLLLFPFIWEITM